MQMVDLGVHTLISSYPINIVREIVRPFLLTVTRSTDTDQSIESLHNYGI